jgi:ArsR family transcriptional regulator
MNSTVFKEPYNPATQQLARMAKALGHPARIAILQTLAERRSCVCGEIVEVLPLAQATVSQHLKELKAAGLVQGTVEGRNSCYCLDPEGLQRMQQQFQALYQAVMQEAQANDSTQESGAASSSPCC